MAAAIHPEGSGGRIPGRLALLRSHGKAGILEPFGRTIGSDAVQEPMILRTERSVRPSTVLRGVAMGR